MALWIPNQAEEIMLDLILAVNTQLKLHQNDPTAGLTDAQINALTEANFTEATFTGYAAKSLTGGSWVSTQGDPSTGTYAQQTFTRTATGVSQTIYGYHVVRASDGKLLWHERFPGPITITNNGETIVLTPTITLEDDQEVYVAAKGLVSTPFLSTANSSTYTTSQTTDMVTNNFDADGTRNYRVHFSSSFVMSGSGTWQGLFEVDGVLTERVMIVSNSSGLTYDFLYAAVLWQPSTGQYDLALYAYEASGTATLTFEGTSDSPRKMWVEDCGPR